MAAQDIRDQALAVGLPSVGDQGFAILSDISGIEIIAAGSSIRDLRRLTEGYGHGR